jgi:hypothetical protein
MNKPPDLSTHMLFDGMQPEIAAESTSLLVPAGLPETVRRQPWRYPFLHALLAELDRRELPARRHHARTPEGAAGRRSSRRRD